MEADDARKTLSSVRLARDHAASGRHGAATALLMQALQSVPQLAEELEGDLTFSLKAYGEHLATIGQPSSALWLYSQAILLLERPRGLLTNLGALQYSLGTAAASIESFQKALALDPAYWPALESLENVKSLAVDRWHYRMLNHSARNEAYSRAIQRAVIDAAAAAVAAGRNPEAGVTVLDIGTGTGILAVLAARAGASHVYACEVNSVLCDVAREVLERNGVADRVTVIHKSSGRLQPGVDLPEGGVDVIVTELVDSGLLGEKIIPVLTDAKARGLLARGGRVVPEGACVYAAVLESDAVRRRSRLLPGNPGGLSSASVCPTIEEPVPCLHDLGRLEHRLLTSPQPVLEVDFLKDGADLMARSATCSPKGVPAAPGMPPPSAIANLAVKCSGRADAVAVWFDLWLDKERGERDVVSTRPGQSAPGDASGWDAGIYFANGANLTEGSEASLGASSRVDRLCFTVNGQEGLLHNSVVAAETPSEVIDRGIGDRTVGEGSLRTAYNSNGPVYLGEMDMARLNDGPFHSSQAKAVAEALVAQGMEISMPAAARHGPRSSSVASSSQTPAHHSPPPAFVLDLCGAWGVAGLLVANMKRSADGAPATRVLAVAESEESAAILNAIARENALGPDRYVATADGLVDLASRGGVYETPTAKGADERATSMATREQRDSGWPGRGSELGWAAVMTSSVVEASGLLKQGGLGGLELCRHFVSDGNNRSNGGRDDRKTSPTAFVPGRLEVVCQGLQRASLLSENRVQSDNCCGVIVDPVNAFSVATFRELDLSAAAPCGHSEGSTPAARNEKTTGGGVDAESSARCVPTDGEKGKGHEEEQEVFLTPSAVCYELDLANVQAGPDGCLDKRSASLVVRRSGTLHAIAYWYRQILGATVVLDTQPRGHPECISASSHFRQAAVLLETPIEVKTGQCIDMCVFCNTSKGVVVQVLGVTEGTGAVGDDM
ncbi:unnamed protein product [Ectocarpus sp. 4 AP-2014]